MKIKGKKIEGPSIVTLVLPREDGDIVIRAQAVLDYNKFEAMWPPPKAPLIRVRGKEHPTPDFDDKLYLQRMAEYGTMKTDFMFLESLKATEGLEWETVVYADPTTWRNYETELSAAGFSDVERQRILNAVVDANCLNEAKLQAARERFLAGIVGVTLENSSSHQPEPISTPPTEPVKGSESVPQP